MGVRVSGLLPPGQLLFSSSSSSLVLLLMHVTFRSPFVSIFFPFFTPFRGQAFLLDICSNTSSSPPELFSSAPSSIPSNSDGGMKKVGSRAGSSPRPPSPRPRDRMSALPSEVLHQILCRLPLDDAVRTSVLARRWRHLWTTNPVLHLTDSEDFSDRIGIRTYVQAITSCVRAYSAEKLVTFSFHLSDQWPYVEELFNDLIIFAAHRKVEELSVMAIVQSYDDDEPNFIETPPSIFLCSFLRTLRLVACSLSCLPLPKKDEVKPLLPALTSLVLCDVEVDDDHFSTLLASCPLLKTLGLSNCVGLHTFVIDSPNMERFCVFDYEDHCYTAIYIKIVNAPNLKWFGLQSDLSLIEPLSAATNLAEVTLFGWMNEEVDYNRQCRKLLSGLPPRVESFAVNPWFLKPTEDDASGPIPSVYMTLKELHFCVFKLTKMAVGALVSKLGRLTLLEKLVVHGDCWNAGDMLYWGQKLGLADIKYADLGFDYVFPCLKNITMLEFSGTDEEMKLVELVMNKGVALESVYLFHKKEGHNSNLLEEKINSFSRASPLARIIWYKNSCSCRISKWGHSLLSGKILG